MSCVYKGTSNDSGIKHWKYVKRVRKNNRWVYYYDTDRLKKDVSNKIGIDKYNNYRDADEAHEQAKLESALATGRVITTQTSAIANDGEISKLEEAKIQARRADADNKQQAYVEAGKKAIIAKSEYLKTPMGKIEQTAQGKFNIVSKIYDKILRKKR